VAEQDLGLRAHPGADLEKPTPAAEREPIVDHRLEEPRLTVQALALLFAVTVEVSVAGVVMRAEDTSAPSSEISEVDHANAPLAPLTTTSLG